MKRKLAIFTLETVGAIIGAVLAIAWLSGCSADGHFSLLVPDYTVSGGVGPLQGSLHVPAHTIGEQPTPTPKP